MTRLTPNPHSPYATANPQYAHIFAVPAFLPTPESGGLLPTACEAMAVVGEDVTETRPGAELPDGLCPSCAAVMNGGEPPARPSSGCRECDAVTHHGELCALCRQEKHDEWWPTRPTATLADASNPIPLRWGLNDVMWGDDDSVIVLLSGPEGEPYWLELDAERAAVLRQDLAGPNAEETHVVADDSDDPEHVDDCPGCPTV